MMDDMLKILSNEHRRRLLMALLQSNPQKETDPHLPDDAVISDAEHDALLVELRHCHLPMLVEAGFIEWKKESREITKGPQFSEIRPLLELFDDHRDELPNDWLYY